MALEKIDNERAVNVSGGAIGTYRQEQIKSFDFHCKKCNHTWTKKTKAPGEEHGCPRCGWWFMSQEAYKKGKWDLECVEYDPNSGRVESE